MQNVWVLASLWVGLALAATLLAIWFKISTALTEIVVGTVAQLIFGAFIVQGGLAAKSEWIGFLAGTGAIVLTFLAGAELDPKIFRTMISDCAATLPLRMGDFIVGREEELQALKQRLLKRKPFLLYGPFGVGKTLLIQNLTATDNGGSLLRELGHSKNYVSRCGHERLWADFACGSDGSQSSCFGVAGLDCGTGSRRD